MRITRSHLKFWKEKQVEKVPSWGEDLETKQDKVSIHELINSQVPKEDRADSDYQISNLLNILKMNRKYNSDIVKKLEEIARRIDPNFCDKDRKRFAFCKKWIKKLKAVDN